MNDLDRMKELIHTLNEAGKAYYQQNKEVMSNLEYDKMYDELLELELPKKQLAKLIAKATGANPKSVYEELINKSKYANLLAEEMQLSLF